MKCLSYTVIMEMFLTITLLAQVPATYPYIPDCSPNGTSEPHALLSAPHGNGRWLTAHGPLKVVFIMAEFPDDDFLPNNTQWPAGDAPVWVTSPRTLVEPISQYGQSTFTPLPFSLADYFFSMSGSNMTASLRMYGTVIHHVYARSRQNIYDNGITADQANIEVLQAVDNQIDFEIFDRWSTTNQYIHSYNSNTYVDLVVICWRNISRDFDQSNTEEKQLSDSLLELGYNNPTRAAINWSSAPDVEVDGGARFIRTGSPGRDENQAYQPTGAGFHFTDFLNPSPIVRSTGAIDGNFRGMVHEIGHHLLDAGHPTSGNWSIVANADHRSYAPSAKEMIELGWTTPTKQILTSTEGTHDVTLRDLYTTGDCITVEVDATGANDKWYVVENHQMISPYDFCSTSDANRNDTKGVYMLYHEQDLVQHIQSASGEYVWDDSRQDDVYGKNGIVFERTAETRSGLGATHSEILPVPGSFIRGQDTLYQFPVYAEWKNGNKVYVDHFLGKTPTDMHTLCNKPVWSPWSSPSSKYGKQGTLTTPINTGVTVWLQDMTGTEYDVRVYTANNFSAPPSVPINFTVPATTVVNSMGISDELDLDISWDANVEPDLDGYRLYRSPGITTTGWELIEDLASTATTYTDNNDIARPSPDVVYSTLAYRLVAYDGQNNESSPCLIKTTLLSWNPVECTGCPEIVPQGGVQEVTLDAQKVLDMMVAPNPATDYVVLYPTEPSELSGDVTLELYSVSGEVVRQFNFIWDMHRKGVSINVEGIATGMYYARISNGTSTRIAKVAVP